MIKQKIPIIELNTKTSPKLSNKKSNELIPKLENLKKYYPLTAEFLIEILRKYSKQYPLLEDWTINTLYFRVWDNYNKYNSYISVWKWLEKKLSTVKENNLNEYNKLKKEIIKEIKSKNTYEMFNQFWNYFTQILATEDLIKKGHKIISYPKSNEKGRSIDIISQKENYIHYSECTFKKKSENLEDLFRKTHDNFLTFKPELFQSLIKIFPEMCSFTIETKDDKKNINAINQEHINAIKNFIFEISKDPQKKLSTEFKDKKGNKYRIIFHAKPGICRHVLSHKQCLKEEANDFKTSLIDKIIKEKKQQINEAIEKNIKNQKIKNQNKIYKNIFIFINPDNKYQFSEALEVGKNKIQEKEYKDDNFNIIIKLLKI